MVEFGDINGMSFIRAKESLKLPFIKFPVSVFHGAFWLSDMSVYITAVIQLTIALM